MDARFTERSERDCYRVEAGVSAATGVVVALSLAFSWCFWGMWLG